MKKKLVGKISKILHKNGIDANTIGDLITEQYKEKPYLIDAQGQTQA